MKNIFRFLRFRFLRRSYATDVILDTMLNKCLDEGIESIESAGSHYLVLTFNGGNSMVAWNVNKYFAWLNKGTIQDYSWQDGMPSKKTMRRLYYAIKDF